MLAKDLIITARFNLDDSQSTKYSDVELMESLNAVLRYINAVLININSYLIVRKTSLEPNDGIARLPDDFVGIRAVGEESTFEIIGNNIYTKLPIDLVYYYTIPNISSLDDDIELPYYFYELLVRFMESLITKSIDKNVFSNLIYTEVKHLCTGSEYPYIERPAPYII